MGGSGNSGGTVASAGSIGFTAILAGVAIVISTLTYVANKRRTNERQTPVCHGALQGKTHRRGTDEQRLQHNSVCTAGGSVTVSTTGGVATGHKSYYAVRAERHVSRHSANADEWRDDVLGVRMLFSPILFAVETEERQAPLVLVGLRYLRQPEHRVAVTIELCASAIPAEAYRESSLARIKDCAKLLSFNNTTRIGNTPLPSAEHCYMDTNNKLRYALSVFLTHEQLAVTAQYVADTPVNSVLPTAFNELVRSIQFSPPRVTPSYLLCAEPRLGLGFRLPLDFVMDDQLSEMLSATSNSPTVAISTARATDGNENGGSIHGLDRYAPPHEMTSGDNTAASARLSFDVVRDHSSQAQRRDDSSGSSCSSLPFAVLTGRGPRRMVVVACYEPLSCGRASWQSLFERHLRTALQRFSVLQKTPFLVVWCTDESPRGKYDKSGTFLVRPEHFAVPTDGDSSVDDGAGNTLLLHGAFCVQEVVLDGNSPCVALLRTAQHRHRHQNNHQTFVGLTVGDRNEAEVHFRAYLCVFCLSIRDECVSFSFLSSTSCHTLEEVVTFCRRMLNTVSLGNHFGQGTSLIYCNTRHEVLPFHILLDPVNAVASVEVEETMVGDPVALIHVGGPEGVTVLLRIFPFSCVSPAPASLRKASTRLEKVVQGYLELLPDRVCIHYWQPTILGSRAALEVNYEQVVNEDDSDVGSVALDEEIGHINPFARYCGTPQQQDEMRQNRHRHQQLQQPQSTTLVASFSSRQSEALLRGGTPSHDSREESASMRVAVVVCFEGCAFLFLASSSRFPFNTVRQVVRQLAANISATVSSVT